MRSTLANKFNPSALAALALILPLINGAAVTPSSSLLKRNVPNKIASCAPEDLRMYQPALDFDTDSCYNTPAIDAEGYLNPGLDINDSPAPEAGCRDEIDLRNNNVYARSRCNNGWCGYMYGYYFEKDKSTHDGHRHDWEHIVVWTQDNQPKYVAASAHGSYDLRHWDDVTKHGDTHPKIVYHKDGILTHAFRFEKAGGEFPENHDQEWFVGDLVGYLGFPSPEIRDLMMNNDWGSAAVDLNEARFAEALKKSVTVHQVGPPPIDTIAAVGFDFGLDGVDPPIVDCGFYPRG